MSDTVIRVENLGKKYIIGHQQQERYTALRDVITNRAKALLNPFQKSKSKIQNSQEEFWALKDVSFEIKQGDRVGIIGRNGAGKSTLLKILSRITDPTTGRIRIQGRVASLLEVGTGFHPELTGRENIYLNGAILGMSRVEIKKKFDEMVAFAEVENFLDTPVKRYSSGMYMRLAFAVAAHLEPEILIVDEVLAVGDVQFQKKCLGKMEDVGKEGRTVLFVSHNMAAMKRLCNMSIHLKFGRVQQIGVTESIIQDYLLRESSVENENRIGQQNLVTDEDIDVINFYACNREGVPKDIFKTSECICFSINYKLKRSLPGLRVGIDFYSCTEGEILFRAFDDDINVQPRDFGELTSICIIPPDLLKPGLYNVSLQIGIHCIRWIVNSSIKRQISVEFLDSVNSLYSDNRPGLIMPKLDWVVKSKILFHQD